MQPNKQTGRPQPPRRPRPIMDMYPVRQPKPQQLPGPAKQPVLISKTKADLDPANGSKIGSKPAVSKKPASDTERPSLAFILAFLLTIILVAAAGLGGYYYFAKYRPAHQPKTAAVKTNEPAVSNINKISDDTQGIKFTISKDLTAIEKAELAKQNPAFIYGFEQKDVPNVKCFISQSKRDKPDKLVAPESLKEGTLSEVKKNNTDVKELDYKTTSLANNHYAASLLITYTDANKVKLKQKFIVTSTKNRVTFAFCLSPEPLYDFYKSKFEPFFESLEVY